MHLLKIDKDNYVGQADPYIIKSGGRYYIYTTGHDGVYAYQSDNLFDGWEYYGKVFSHGDLREFWAPSVIELDGKFYMYNSMEVYDCEPDQGGHRGAMFVSVADSPLGPFGNPKQILPPFSIDSHIVKNEAGLFLFYSTNEFEGERIGTHIVVDRMLDPIPRRASPLRWLSPLWTRIFTAGTDTKRASTGTPLRAHSILRRTAGTTLCIPATALSSPPII